MAIFLSKILTLGSISYILQYQLYIGSEDLEEKLLKAEHELTALKEHHIQLQELFISIIEKMFKKVPQPEYEKLRRRIGNNIQEFWYFINSEISKLKNMDLSTDLISTFDNVLSMGIQQKRTLTNDIERIILFDGFNEWRINEIKNLSDIVQKRLRYLQNPVDCKNSKKLVCHINYSCGFGCQIHHLVSCMIVAYGTQRTLILKSNNWRYHNAGWEEIFLPLSHSCTEIYDAIPVKWPGTNNSQVIMIPTEVSILPRPKYLPLVVPEDLASRLITVHGNPIVWWIGQIIKYIWKPQNITSSYIENKMDELQIQNPYVGVHIRRTDKIGTEASFHDVKEYMKKVDEFYNQIDINGNLTTRRVYIATDDFNTIIEAQNKYPHYEIIYNPDIPKVPISDSLHSSDNIFSIILDLHALSHSDFLVCTFSSNICRLAYELMQIDHVDASAKFASLDDVYYYSQQDTNRRKTIIRHQAQTPKEIDLLPGDIVHIAGNHWDGYSLGTNLRTNKFGLYPSFKVDIETEVISFPIYSEIDNKEINAQY
ncbi:hypothetical protein FQR65_LT10855 [Abscondita terminalis]|nr:hypothetical protein FQR65_LT10855 [Abscondita terminalis]